ncbi:LysE family translocator [Sphaerisporangium corydalis]|uniref:LysE family translocator n=1 Tax=Sphaerisporangium corydalis TaxID=1441875 RepID=A0ABV9E9Z0_9ACTN|nr:LysE family transporter [Sphaerisporangium corydalis]
MTSPMISVAFLTGSLVVIVTPGPDLALITRLVLTWGRLRPAVAAAAGMVAAGAAQAAVGALGMAALLAAEPALFTALRWAGATVLIGMAVPALRSALWPPARAGTPGGDAPAGRAFLQGLACTGTNPKVGVFLMAFLPQFVPPGVEPARGVALLAAVYLGLVLLWLLTWMTVVGRLAKFVHTPAVTRVTCGLTAAVFTFFAVRLALGA